MQAKIAPQDLNAEAALLFSVLYRPETLPEVSGLLTPQDLFSSPHRAILGAAMAIHAAGSPVDMVTVSSALADRGELDMVGGMNYLESLLDYESVISSKNLAYYVKVVREKSLLRQLDSICERSGASLRSNPSFDAIYGQTMQQLIELGQSAKGLTKPVFSSAMSLVQSSLRSHANRLATGIKLSTGLTKLDEATTGIHPKEFWILAGRPSMGKSSCMTSMALSLAKHGHVLVFSLEMPGEDIADRILCNLSGLRMSDILDVTKGNRRSLVASAIQRVPANIRVNDWCRNPQSIIAHIRAVKEELAQKGELISGVFVDHLGKIQHPQAAREDQSIGKTTGMFANAAKDLDVPIIVLSQINRGVQSRDDKRPVMSDLAESGRIEQDADVIAMLYRDEYYHPDSDDKGVAEIIITKQRNGPTGTVRVRFDKASTLFRDLEETYEPYRY